MSVPNSVSTDLDVSNWIDGPAEYHILGIVLLADSGGGTSANEFAVRMISSVGIFPATIVS